MTALDTERATFEKATGKTRYLPVAQDAIGYAGGIAVLDGGFLKPGETATGLVAVGVLQESYDNTGGSDGDIGARVDRGIFPFANSGGADEITRTEIGSDCYIVDDQTVAKTSGSSTRSVAGKVFDVDADGVWVEFR